MSPTAPDSFRFRSLSAATKRARYAAHGYAQWLHEITEFLSKEVELPNIDIPELDLPERPELITEQDIEEAADATRRAWKLREGPIVDLIKLLESCGIIIARFALNAEKLDGLSGISMDGRPYIILNSEKAACVRSRFDAAHELGHFVLHRHASFRPESQLHKLMENQAHRFAGAFIFPRAAVLDEVTRSDLDSLVSYKERWKINVGAIVFRLYQLELITKFQKDRLQRQINACWGRLREKLDDKLQLERPTVIRKAYQLLCEEGGWTPTDIKRAVPLADYDHELLAGLPSRWMASHYREYGELVRLKPRNESRQQEKNVGEGRVIKFPGTARDDSD